MSQQHQQQKKFTATPKAEETKQTQEDKSILDETKEVVEESYETVKKAVSSGVDTVKEKVLQGEEMFAEEIEEGKKMVKEGAKAVTSGSRKTMDWLMANWQTLVGIICLGIGVWRLWEFIIGVIFTVAGVLLIIGYFKDIQPKHAKKVDAQEVPHKK